MKEYLKLFVFLVCCFLFGFALSLAVSNALQADETTTRIEGGSPQVEVAAIQVMAGPLAFESGKIYYVHPEALEGVTQIRLDGVDNTEIHFVGAPLKGERMYWTDYANDIGILNIVDCNNLTITGLDVENTYQYQAGNVVLESCVAVNVSRSTATFKHCTVTGTGKSTFMVHSGSDVTVEDSTINGYYFEFNVGGSNLTARRVVLNQDHEVADSHSAIWTSSSARNGETNVLYENTNVVLEDVTFNMLDGRSVVSGNGSYTTMSNVTLRRPVFQNTDATFGIAAWHENYNSITVTFDEFTPVGLVDYISTPNSGFGRFVNHYATPTTPGGPNGEAPIMVDGVSSENITP